MFVFTASKYNNDFMQNPFRRCVKPKPTKAFKLNCMIKLTNTLSLFIGEAYRKYKYYVYGNC